MPDPRDKPMEHDPRIYFAGERTTLAWLRTGIAMMGFGFVVARFGLFLRELAAERPGHLAEATAHQPTLSMWVGTALLLLGVYVNLAAAVQHFRFRRAFEAGEPFVTPRGWLVGFICVIVAVMGIGMTAYLLTMR